MISSQACHLRTRTNRTYYVSTDGNPDITDCTDENYPCQTMEQAWTQLNIYGDGIIEIGPGEFDFNHSLYFANKQIIIKGYGIEFEHTTIKFMLIMVMEFQPNLISFCCNLFCFV